MRLFYSSIALWNIFSMINGIPRLEPTVWKNLKAAGIAKLASRRGCRAGAKKPRAIKVICGYGRYMASCTRVEQPVQEAMYLP